MRSDRDAIGFAYMSCFAYIHIVAFFVKRKIDEDGS
jgi:hypothetical protein